jgi:hypothetical protein
VYTLGGRKIMDLAMLEDIISQIIHDPRIRFNTVTNNAFMKQGLEKYDVFVPETPFSVLLTKFKRLYYPDDIEWDCINNNFNTHISFKKFLKCVIDSKKTEISIICNLIIRSNYKFSFNCKKDTVSPIYQTIIQSKENKEREYIMTVDHYVVTHEPKNHCNSIIDDYYLTINEDESDLNPSRPIWFYMTFSVIILGEDLTGMFTNIAYRLNPTDKTTPLITNGPDGIRLLTSDELKLVSNEATAILPTSMDAYYDIELATKYLAATPEQTGLDLSSINLLN